MTHSARRLAARLAAAVLATAAAGLGVLAQSAPASAATCGTGSGVSVVVDFGGSGGVRTDCVLDGAGKTAASLFKSAGFDLAYVQNEPGFVCRIDGFPSSNVEACVNTPPEDAYWALWWSDGTSGDWAYSNYGAGTLKVPDGAYVGFAWQTGSKSPPGAAPTPHPSTPTASATPTPSVPSTGSGGGSGSGGHGGGHGGSGGGHASSSPTARPSSPSASPTAGGTPSGSATASPSASPTKTGHGGKHRTPSATPTPSSGAVPAPATDSAAPSVSPQEPSEVAASSGGTALPVWVVPLVILILGAGASVFYVKRRRDRPSP